MARRLGVAIAAVVLIAGCASGEGVDARRPDVHDPTYAHLRAIGRLIARTAKLGHPSRVIVARTTLVRALKYTYRNAEESPSEPVWIFRITGKSDGMPFVSGAEISVADAQRAATFKAFKTGPPPPIHGFRPWLDVT